MILRFLATFMLALALCGPAWFQGALIGSQGAEVYGHAWVQYWTSQGWPEWPMGTALALNAIHRPVIDPLPGWLFAALPLNIVQGWNLRVLGSLMLAGWGGGALAESHAKNKAGWWLGMVGMMTAPIYLGSVISGLTEDFSWGLVLLAIRDMRERRLGRGALLLGLSAGCGLYLAWMGGLWALGVGLWAIRSEGGWRRWGMAGVLAGMLVGMFAWPFRGRLDGEEGSFRPPAEEPHWRLNPWRGSDLASYWVAGKDGAEGAFIRQHPSYVGYGVLGLAILGGPEASWIGVAACMTTAAGPEFSWGGKQIGISNPLIPLFSKLPAAKHWHHYARLMLLGQSLLLMLAARGLQKRPRLAILAPFLVLLENILLSPAPFPLPGADASSPSILGALSGLPEGPVIVIPSAGPGIHPQKIFYDQHVFERPLLMDPDRPGALPPRIPPGTLLVVSDSGAIRADFIKKYGPPVVETEDGAAWVTTGYLEKP